MTKLSHLHSDEAAKAAQDARNKVLSKRRRAINRRGRARAIRELGEARNAADSIASFCAECITAYGLDVGGAGSVHAAIEACTSVHCHLYPWRDGKFHAEEVIGERG